jgi:hypothetical protein
VFITQKKLCVPYSIDMIRLFHPIPITDEQRLVFRIRDPIKTLYVRTQKELVPNADYYISIHIGNEPISFTNKFKKVIIDGIELYELDLFAKKLILHMEICIYDFNNAISVDGWNAEAVKETIEMLTDIYYEKGDPLNQNDLFVQNDIGQKAMSQTSGSFDQVIIYNDSELTQKIRRERSTFDVRKTYGEKVYGKKMDNVLRYLSFMQGLAYENELKKIIPSI